MEGSLPKRLAIVPLYSLAPPSSSSTVLGNKLKWTLLSSETRQYLQSRCYEAKATFPEGLIRNLKKAKEPLTEMQLKTMRSHYFISIRMITIKKQKITNVDEDIKKIERREL